VSGAFRAAHPDGVDAVLDLVNGPDAIRRDAEILKSGGSLVSTIYAADEGWFAERKITAHNISSSTNPFSSRQGLTGAAGLLAYGTITARIRTTVDLDGAGQMLEKLRRCGLRGKAVIRL
jgi:D-arabinose 1-dehydrogenase-like Zn-dependent alcohol dehydrogenase